MSPEFWPTERCHAEGFLLNGLQSRLAYRINAVNLFFCTDESHRRNQELLSGCDRGESDTRGRPHQQYTSSSVGSLIVFLLCSFLPVLCQYAHIPFCFGVKPHGRQQLRVSFLFICCCKSSGVLDQADSYFHCPRRLAGGLPPYASVYPTWLDCWKHLSREVNPSHTKHACQHLYFI